MNSSKEMDFALAVAGKFGKSLISGGVLSTTAH